MHIGLSAEMQRFVEDQVASGRFASADAVVAASLAMLAGHDEERLAFDAELGRRLECLDRGEFLTADDVREHFQKRGEELRTRRHANAA